MDLLSYRLSAARKAAGLTQRELAERTGMNQSHLSHVERGNRGLSSEALRSVARVLGVSVSHLLGEDATAPSRPAQRTLREDAETPAGLRELAADDRLTASLQITDAEWHALRSIDLPAPATRDGYVQLLFTIRAITRA